MEDDNIFDKDEALDYILYKEKRSKKGSMKKGVKSFFDSFCAIW